VWTPWVQTQHCQKKKKFRRKRFQNPFYYLKMMISCTWQDTPSLKSPPCSHFAEHQSTDTPVAPWDDAS
jgi:hypothetical protein